MASTNKTTNYNLSQFIGSDKPAWLSDYNQDMTKIDTAIKNASDTATSASGSAGAATTAIGVLTDLTTTAKTNLVSAINEVDGEAATAQGTASSASTAANNALTAITNLNSYLKMSQFTNPTATVTGSTISTNEISCASNSTGTLGKIYGRLFFTANINGTVTISFASPFRPTSALTINGSGLVCWAGSSWSPSAETSIEIATDGTCTIQLNVTSGNNYRLFFFNSTLFITDFGDIPTPE